MTENIDPEKIFAATEALKALANERRLLILCLLLDGPCNVTELQTATGFSQSNLSQHLNKMRSMGVLTSKRDGKQVYYALSHPAFKKIIEALKEIFCP